MADDFIKYKTNFSEEAFKALQVAIGESRKRRHYSVDVEHLLWAVIKEKKEAFSDIFDKLGYPITEIERILDSMLTVTSSFNGAGFTLTSRLTYILERSIEDVKSRGAAKVEVIDLIASILRYSKDIRIALEESLGIESSELIAKLGARIKIDAKTTPEKEAKKKYELTPYLTKFGTNLNGLVAAGKITKVIGRRPELTKMIEILSHREGASSVMLVGEPGVGKTAIVEGLAELIENEPEALPERLRGHQIINLQMNSLVAGTIYRGMFEERLENIIKELKHLKNAILFVDEAHTIVGAGEALGVPSDAANILKSALSRGDIQIIGATTLTEYNMFIAEDEALARRFRTVRVNEPTNEEVRQIVCGIRERYEKLYSVTIPDAIVDLGLELSSRYQHNIKQPHKIISWLNTAAVKTELAGVETVDARILVEVISGVTEVPTDMIFREASKRLSTIEEMLGRRVVGQKEAIGAVAKRLRLNKSPLKENFMRPDGVLLFLGPTGVGKTELAKAAAQFLFGDEKKMLRIDMSEYKDGSLAVDKLIGTPRGIVGSERGGLLSGKVKDNPYTIILLDEIEKASSYVLNLFLQVFDEGFLTDGRGKKIYFSDAFIIMTSNVGSSFFQKLTKPLGFLDAPDKIGAVKAEVMKELETSMTPEFLNRIDDVIIFTPLTEPEVKQIARNYIDKLKYDMEQYGKSLGVSEEAVEKIAESGYSIKYGARFLKRYIDDHLKLPIVESWALTDFFYADVIDGAIEVHVRELSHV